MLIVEETCDLGARRDLVKRVVASALICKSARLRELLLYLCGKVLDEQVSDLHELEVGYHVFGRPEYYDTAADNIVRVHASLLRKRLAEYFRTEGCNEDLIIEIPRGNYAPVFRVRELAADPAVHTQPKGIVAEEGISDLNHRHRPVAELLRIQPFRGPSVHPNAWVWLAVVVVAAIGSFLIRNYSETHAKPVRALVAADTRLLFFSNIFQEHQATAVVLDDASLDLYQEATGHPVSLAEYFDRSYLNSVEQSAERAHLDPHFARSFLLRRQSSFASANLIGELTAVARQLGSEARVQFARDFTFRQLKTGNAVLLGSAGSNPWIQPFENSTSVRWVYNQNLNSYYPVDTRASVEVAKQFEPKSDDSHRTESYATIVFVPNLGETGRVLIISSTGGTAASAALSFLTNPVSMAQLAAKLPKTGSSTFPYFEILLRVDKSDGPRNTQILLCRSPDVHQMAGR